VPHPLLDGVDVDILFHQEGGEVMALMPSSA